MTASLLFISTFCLVLALGLQSQLVNNGHYIGAFINSLCISLGQLGALHVIHATSFLQYLAYMTGGPFGIVTSMFIYRKFLKRS